MPFTKIFEYKVTGTLAEPKRDPAYIPKLFYFPFRPFKTIKEMFPESSQPAATVPAPTTAEPPKPDEDKRQPE